MDRRRQTTLAILRFLLRRVVVVVVLTNVGVALLLLAEAPVQVHRRTRTVRAQTALPDSSRIDLARYRLARRPFLDSLLPDAHLGTVIAADLGGPTGVAWSEASVIAILAGSLDAPTEFGGALQGEMVELHERAHLLHANHPELVTTLLGALPPPATQSYAAKSGGEHFAEMASQAYQLLLAEDGGRQGFCIDITTALRNAEERVPGTSGFLLYFLQQVDGTHPADNGMRDLALSIRQPTAGHWQPIYAALDAQRGADGRLTRWPVPPLGLRLRDTQSQLRLRHDWWGRAVGAILWPGAVMARAVSAAQV